MEQKIKLQSFVLPFALMAGLTRVLIDFLPKVMGASAILYFSTFAIAFILEIIFVVYVIKLFKKKNGSIELKQSITIGIIIMLVLGLMYTSSSFAYDTYINPDFQREIQMKFVENGTPEQIEAVENSLKAAEDNKDKAYLGIPLYTLWFVFLGFVISLITGSILKTKQVIQ